MVLLKATALFGSYSLLDEIFSLKFAFETKLAIKKIRLVPFIWQK